MNEACFDKRLMVSERSCLSLRGGRQPTALSAEALAKEDAIHEMVFLRPIGARGSPRRFAPRDDRKFGFLLGGWNGAEVVASVR